MPKPYDFSCKSHILLEDEDGTRLPMSEPYFRDEKIGERTWKILTDGDFSYLLEGEDGDAILIDSGYGAGNIREHCEELLGHPVSRIINTHDHFDHTALDGLFDLVYMSPETFPLATLPFPSFDGIDFPRNYTVQLVKEGDIIPLKGRDLLVIEFADHAVGSILLLDRTDRLLFVGDELGMPFGKPVRTTVENVASLLMKLVPFRKDYDKIWGGAGHVEDEVVKELLANCQDILKGIPGEPQEERPFNNWEERDEEGHIVWKRRLPHPGDGPRKPNEDAAFLLQYGREPFAILYDSRKVFDA